MRNSAVFIALALSAACDAAPRSDAATVGADSAAVSTALSAEDEAAIRAVDVEWERAASAGDATALMAVYAPDATLLPPNEPTVQGEAVKKYNADMTNSFSGPYEITTTAVEGRGDLAYVVGKYRATLTPKKAGAKPLPAEEGKYIEVMKKQADGAWKIVYEMWSQNAPPGQQ